MATENLRINELPLQYIFPIHPQEYLYQHGANCGPRAIKGVLSAFGKDIDKDLQDYNKFWIGKKFGQMLPSQMIRIFNENGMNAKKDDAGSLSKEGKLQFIKEKIHEGSPVILLVGNGYDKKGRYWRSFGAITKHYVTVYGYDDEDKQFYIYDPCVKKENQDKDIPIGNIARTYDAVIRDWNYGITPGIGRNVLISVSN